MSDHIFALTIKGTFDIFMIEFKAPGKDATKQQLLEHKRAKTKGGLETFVIDDIDEGKALIDRRHARLSEAAG